MWTLWLLHLVHVFLKVHCVNVIPTNMPWTQGFKKCHLANKEEVDSHIERYRAWVGAVSVYTPWMIHEECNPQSPFRLDAMCRCAEDTQPDTKTNPVQCNNICCGSKQDRCGSSNSKYVNLFRHVKGRYQPYDNFLETELADTTICSVLVVAPNTFHFEAEHWWKKHKFLCEHDKNGLSTEESYSSAKKICHLKGSFKSDNISKFQLTNGKYWTAIHRVRTIRWLEKETLQDLCKEFGSIENMKCILVDHQSGTKIVKMPIKCTEWHPILCSRKKESAISNVDIWAGCNKDTVASTTSGDSTSIRSTDSPSIRSTDSPTIRSTDSPSTRIKYVHHRRTEKDIHKCTSTAGHQTDNGEKTTFKIINGTDRIYEQTRHSTQYNHFESQTSDMILLPTEYTNTSISPRDTGQFDNHYFIQISVISLALFFIGIATVGLITAYFKKRRSSSSDISQEHHYFDLQPIDYDHLQIPAILSSPVFVKTEDVESHYIEIT